MTTQVKYKLGEREANGLCRVIALVAFSDVAVGDVGGYVKAEQNLAHTGDAWVYGNAWVFGDARVSGDAQVFGDAQVYGDARVYGNARVYGDARVSGNARVSGDAWVHGNAWVFGDARVSGDAQVFGNARVSGDAWVSGNARVSGNAWVSEDAQVSGDAWVSVVCLEIPKVITGLLYTLTITDEHLRAGCQVHTFHDWRTKTEREVLAMDGKAALVFYKETLIPLMDALKLGV